MKILLVEDDAPKRANVMAAILEVDGIDIEDVSHAPDARTAKQLLLETRYDVMIVDLVLPIRSDEDPVPDGGAGLVEELLVRDQFKKPSYVIGLSAYEKAVSAASQRLREFLFTAIQYDPAVRGWRAAIQHRLRHALEVSGREDVRSDYDLDVAFLCALEEPELGAVLALPWDWSPYASPGDDAIYHRGTVDVGSDNERRLNAVAVAAPRMGLPAAAVAATKIIYTFRPRILVMTGISAGIAGGANIGDVLVADPCWDWGSGKWGGSIGPPFFSPHPHQLPSAPSLLRAARVVAGDAAGRARIRDAWRGPKPETALRVLLGPVAAGAAVLAHEEMVETVVSQNRKVVGIDMESYGVLAAATDSSEPRPKAIVIKGVADHGGSDKSDQFQSYAAYTSATVVDQIVRSVLAPDP